MNNTIRNISSPAIIFSLMIFTSCVRKNQDELKRTDSLMNVLDSAENKFLASDSTRIQNVLDSMNHKTKLIQKFASDTLDKEMTIFLSDYLRIQQALEKYYPDRRNIIPQITLSKKQLDNMKHDLNNGAISKEEFEKYFPEEERAVTELSSYISMTTSKAYLLLLQYDFIRTKVDFFITTLDTIHQREEKNPDLSQENIDTD